MTQPKIIYLDCFAGISGDMMVAALLDLGLDLAGLERELQKLPLDGFRLQVQSVNKLGIQATRFEVILSAPGGEHLADSEFQEVAPGATVGDPAEVDPPRPEPHHHHHSGQAAIHPHRSLNHILALINNSDLSVGVKATAGRIFTRLGEAEARVHGQSLEEVHFHEVGGVDAIIDIVSTAIGLEHLGIEEVYASPLHLGRGFVRCAHGLYPVPAPATANLVTDVPVYTTAAKGELVTPTGAAIITTLAREFGPMPLMVAKAIGYGAGSRDREFPNVLRAHVGEPVPAAAAAPAGRDPFPEQHQTPPGPAGYHDGPAVVIEASIDDMTPPLFAYVMERLLQADALDVLLIPVQMKKNRPGTVLQVLAHPDSVERLIGIIFSESTSIGVRTYPVTKHMLPRSSHTVDTPFGPVRVKVAYLKERAVNLAPEYEDCRRLARQHNIPLKEVYDAARLAFVQHQP